MCTMMTFGTLSDPMGLHFGTQESTLRAWFRATISNGSHSEGRIAQSVTLIVMPIFENSIFKTTTRGPLFTGDRRKGASSVMYLDRSDTRE